MSREPQLVVQIPLIPYLIGTLVVWTVRMVLVAIAILAVMAAALIAVPVFLLWESGRLLGRYVS